MLDKTGFRAVDDTELVVVETLTVGFIKWWHDSLERIKVLVPGRKCHVVFVPEEVKG